MSEEDFEKVYDADDIVERDPLMSDEGFRKALEESAPLPEPYVVLELTRNDANALDELLQYTAGLKDFIIDRDGECFVDKSLEGIWHQLASAEGQL